MYDLVIPIVLKTRENPKNDITIKIYNQQILVSNIFQKHLVHDNGKFCINILFLTNSKLT